MEDIHADSDAWPRHLDHSAFPTLQVIGDPSLLSSNLLGILCSRQVSGEVILKTYDALLALRKRGQGIVGGFHSPMEQECLELALRGGGPVVICPARSLERMRLPANWSAAIVKQHAAVVSACAPGQSRMTGRLADHRNSLVAALSKQLFVPLASPGGKIEGLCLELLRAGKRVLTLDESNKALISAGAEVVEPVAM